MTAYPQRLRQALVSLYRQMAEHTKPECGACTVPNDCCAPEYCGMAERWARDKWGVDLTPLKRPGRLPFLQNNECVVLPHLRPLCTLHTCDVNAFGGKLGDEEWTDHYFHLRTQIDYLEWHV